MTTTLKGKKIVKASPNTTPIKKGEEHLAGLTPKQYKFVKNSAKQFQEKGSVNLTEAARAAYDVNNQKSATNTGSIIMKNPKVREAYLAELEASGVTDEKLSRVMNEALDAEKTLVINRKTGETMQVPDHATRLKTAQEAHRLKGVYADTRHVTEKKVAHLHMFSGMQTDTLLKKQKELQKEIDELSKGEIVEGETVE